MFSKQSLFAFGLASGAFGIRLARPKTAAADDCYSMYDGSPLLEVTPCSTAQLEQAMEFFEQQGRSCKILADELPLPSDGSCSDFPVVCNEESSASAIKSVGQFVNIRSPDAGDYYRKQSGVPRKNLGRRKVTTEEFLSDWRDLDQQNARVEAAVAASGGLATLETAGLTYRGRPIKLVRLRGAGWSPGMTRNVFTFNLHAREWITGMAGVYAVEKFIEMVKANPEYIKGMEVVMVPMANPDGFLHSTTQDRFHRKNMNFEGGVGCNGVDLNRNFDFAWAQGGSSSSCYSDTYHGSSGASEPETKVISKIFEEAPMNIYIDVHSYAQMILSSWGYTRKDHPRSAEFRRLGGAMKEAVEKRHGTQWTEGPGAQVLYAASGGSDDYATNLGALGFTFELRPGGMKGIRGFAPPTSDILPSAEETFEGLLVAVSFSRQM